MNMGMSYNRVFSIARGVFASALLGLSCAPIAAGMAASEDRSVELWRLDCGNLEISDLGDYSDTYAYQGRSKTFVGSCYLIRHGAKFLLWDTGLSAKFLGKEGDEGGDRMHLQRRLVDQLAELGVKPSQIDYVGISHYHYDHTGQAVDFPQSKLLIDRRDWAVVKEVPRLSAALAPWSEGPSSVQPLDQDFDVFGDQSVKILRMPGHTPGHRALLIRLKERGPVLLSGDAVHFRENWVRRGVPTFNTSRAETLASFDRLADVADQLSATLIIQHEPSDVALLPQFPRSER